VIGPAGQLDAVLAAGIGDVGGGVDDADDPAPPGDGVLHLVEDLGGLLDRHGEQVDQEQERQQLAEVTGARGSEPTVPTTRTTAVVSPDTNCPAVKATTELGPGADTAALRWASTAASIRRAVRCSMP
jgi:hypothetical protein